MGKIVVTGSSGFIGQNLALSLPKKYQIILVDKKNINKFKNFNFINNNIFLKKLEKNKIKKIDCIFHQGANSDTTEKNLSKIYLENFEYSKRLLDLCIKNNINFIYASSASVYGTKNSVFEEKKNNIDPDNHYAFSKSLFDEYVEYILKKKINKIKIVGLRYFNVYGPHEDHKNDMSSVMYKFYNQFLKFNQLKLFKGHNGYKNGYQKRDFIYIQDVINVNKFFFKKNVSGIFNCGTGISNTYNKIANTVINYVLTRDPTNNKKFKNNKFIKYINMPVNLKDKYQNYTKANLNKLRDAGYDKKFISIEDGINAYLDFLSKKNK